jgi:multiple sugar transport system ATP-binding protein
LEQQEGRIEFRNAHLSLDVSHYPFAQRPAPGQECVLGVRPECIEIGHGDGAPNLLTAPVTLVEAMGATRVLWLDFFGTPIAGVVQDQQVVEIDHPVAFNIRSQRISLFDAASELRL